VRITSIIGIETTTFCNLDCEWCPNSTMEHRHMDERTFDQSIKVLERLKKGIIYMNGCGEPLMDPDIAERVSRVSKLGYSPEMFTNGYFITRKLMLDLNGAGLRRLWVSEHRNVDKKINIALNAGIRAVKAYSPAVGGRTHNFAGQHGTVSERENRCGPKEEGWFYISVLGFITQCCLDYRALYPVSHVFSTRINDINTCDIPLCGQCKGSP